MLLDWGALIPLWFMGGRQQPPIPVVLVSAAPMVERLATGMEGYLKKPVDLSSLIGAVQRFVPDPANG